MIKPLPHQTFILEELTNKYRALIKIPSGAGKTHTAAYFINDLQPKTFLYIVHRNEILQQSQKIFRDICDFMNDYNTGNITQYDKNFSRQYNFATIQTISKDANLEKLSYYDAIIIDEAHHVAAATYQKVLNHLQYKYLLGLSATPDRHDKQDILKYFDNNVVGNIDIFEGIQRNILVPFYYRGLYDNINYDNIRWNGYKYVEFDLDKYLLIDSRDNAVINEYRKYIEPENRLTIGFCNSVNHIKRMVEKFNQAGIKAVGISHEDKFIDRKVILELFRKGYYKALFTRDILNEGVDFPECEALMFLRPTYSKTIFLQQLGRGLRKRQNKENVLVLDFLGNYKNVSKIKDYLIEITKSEPGVLTGDRTKPIYRMNMSVVKFDQRVIDIIELQDSLYRPNEYISKEKLLEYFKTKLPDELPFPGLRTIDHKNGYKYANSLILNRFGSYYNLLLELGKIDGTDHNPPYYSMKHFKMFYQQIKSILGKVPTGKDIDRLYQQKEIPLSSSKIEGCFGSVPKFIELMGDKPRFTSPKYRQKTFNEWSVDLMIKLYKETKQDLKIIPRLADLDSRYPGYDRAHLKFFNNNYPKFLEFMEGVKGLDQKCVMCHKIFINVFTNTNFRKRKTCSEKCKYSLSKFKIRQKHGLEHICVFCKRGFCKVKGGVAKFCSPICRTNNSKIVYYEKSKLLGKKPKIRKDRITISKI